jgi:hypothetical protein
VDFFFWREGEACGVYQVGRSCREDQTVGVARELLFLGGKEKHAEIIRWEEVREGGEDQIVGSMDFFFVHEGEARGNYQVGSSGRPEVVRIK